MQSPLVASLKARKRYQEGQGDWGVAETFHESHQEAEADEEHRLDVNDHCKIINYIILYYKL